MTHPEIPKDHPRFEQYESIGDQKGVRYWYYLDNDDKELRLDSLYGLTRQDCAAHAAAWWFNRSQEICDSENGDPLDMLKANEIALAWLKWGAE